MFSFHVISFINQKHFFLFSGPEAPQYMSELLSNNNKIMDDLQDTNDQLYQLADDLARSGRRPEKRPAEEDLFVPDGISPDLVKVNL